MPDNDQRRGIEARGAGHSGAVRNRGVRIGRTAVTGWALASVLAVAGFGTAMGATPVAVAQPVAVADTTDTGGTSAGAIGLDPLALLPTARPLAPSAVLPDLPTIAPAPTATATENAAPQTGTGDVVAPVPGAQLRQAEFTTDAPDIRAATAIRTALAQIGLPYVWGGNGPTYGDAGFDCSGLTTFSYANAGVSLPRTAHTQYNAGPHVPDGAPLQPGDLVFYGTTARVHHVGMYLGAGRMVNAPTFGRPVQVAFYRYNGDDYLGATRPAASPGSLTSGILPFVDPGTLPAVPRSAPEQIFTAPTAPMVALPQPGDPTLPPEQVSAAQAVQEAAALSVATGVARSAAVAGATTSTSAPVTTEPAVGTATTGTATGVATSTAPSTAVAGTTTSTIAPVTSTTSTVTGPSTAPQAVAGSSTATSTLTSTISAPGTTKAATPTTKKAAVVPKTTTAKTTAASTTEPKATTATKTTTAPTTSADDVTTPKAVKTTAEDDATTAEKSTEKSSEKSTEKSSEKSSEKSGSGGSGSSGSSSSSSSSDGSDGSSSSDSSDSSDD